MLARIVMKFCPFGIQFGDVQFQKIKKIPRYNLGLSREIILVVRINHD